MKVLFSPPWGETFPGCGWNGADKVLSCGVERAAMAQQHVPCPEVRWSELTESGGRTARMRSHKSIITGDGGIRRMIVGRT